MARAADTEDLQVDSAQGVDLLLVIAAMAEDLIAAAFNDAANKIDAESQSRMGSATAGMKLPPGMKLPF